MNKMKNKLKFNHEEIFSIVLNVVYVTTQVSLITFALYTCIINI